MTVEESVPPVETEGANAPDLSRKLSWIDAGALATAMQTGVIASLGYTMGAVGALGALAVWGAATVIALLQNHLYAEMAMMFPKETGGISLFAHQAWRRYTTLVGPLASFGYWFAWSVTLGVFGETIGYVVVAEWFPESTWELSAGPVHLSLPTVIAIATIIFSWALNIIGIRTAALTSRIFAVGLTVFTAVVMFVPFFAGEWSGDNLQWHFDGGIKTFLVWMFVAAWSVYGTEICATFAPEYQNPRRDTYRALRVSALFILAVFVITPISTGGALTEDQINANPLTYSVLAVTEVWGSGVAHLLIALIVMCLFLAMVASQADGGRALLGIAREGMTLKQVEKLNRFGEPGRALTFDAVINIAFVLLFTSPLVLLMAGNLGYMVCTCFVVSGFLLLRRDRPTWPRPIRLGRPWLAVAWLILVIDVAVTVVGATDPGAAGYGSAQNGIVGACVLLLSVVFYAYRRVVQDKQPMAFRHVESEAPPSSPTRI